MYKFAQQQEQVKRSKQTDIWGSSVYFADLLVRLSQEKFAPYDFTLGLALLFSVMS